ncbi:sigma 54-interacting transcriptional regulator [Archangium sp.]|uniref:sigma 54-interacting transcriptional regulator n=1 Tax=Archangium sp. TaxID=1872627 RepID=UPI0038D494DA
MAQVLVVDDEVKLGKLVAESPLMKQALASARQVAASEASVVLLGESGTGKSQLARLIHFSSKRAAGPLVEVHCAALPETLLEGELFGHEESAFTGATERKAGHMAAAKLLGITRRRLYSRLQSLGEKVTDTDAD